MNPDPAADVHNLVFQLGGDIRIIPATVKELDGHNVEGHMVVGDVTGRGMDMMNPLVNIFFPEFWRLHYFINDRFGEQLASYAQSAHPDLGLATAPAIVDHIEETHHTALAFV